MEKNEKIKEAVEELTGMSKDEELRILAELRIKGRRDEYARRQYAIKQGLQEGRERGLEEGRKEGIKEGIKEGRKEGIKEGIKEGRKEGIKEGRKEGIKEGRKEGIKEGREEGIKEGIEQDRIEIAKKMIKKKMKIEDICEITGLTIEEIEELK